MKTFSIANLAMFFKQHLSGHASSFYASLKTLIDVGFCRTLSRSELFPGLSELAKNAAFSAGAQFEGLLKRSRRIRWTPRTAGLAKSSFWTTRRCSSSSARVSRKKWTCRETTPLRKPALWSSSTGTRCLMPSRRRTATVRSQTD